VVSDNEYSFAHGAQRNFGDLTPYFTYASILNFIPPISVPSTYVSLPSP
jgi:hypothetical protein